MVLNIGIFPFWGNISVYNTETQTCTKFDISPVKEDSTNNDIDLMYKEIKSKLGDMEIGCICIALGYSYLNDIRKSFIKYAKENGTKDAAKIISGKQARFIGMLEKSGTHLIEDEVIWILAVWENNIICDVWEKVGDHCIYKVNYGQSKTNPGKSVSPTTNDLQKLYEKIGLKPTRIFAEGYIVEDEIVKAFPNCKLFALKENNKKHEWTEYALTMARIMNGDEAVLDYNANGVLQRKIELTYNEKSLIKVEEFEPLPYHAVISIKTDDNESILDILERYNLVDKIKLPSNTVADFEFNIDENGIYSYKIL